ncbi:hypothetical protein TPA0910_58400 [Streptomyces hygroscopicus subsp. sporocinereus]|uniref:Uncharacterized protein n=1 Tax=Streptomyces hygroscopicus TaxID=1912 RepID=A0ABQ3U7H4_STRHY|nr:hypothetical protein TPA0910_58400 [Streptomyces hygroscopicus]
MHKRTGFALRTGAGAWGTQSMGSVGAWRTWGAPAQGDTGTRGHGGTGAGAHGDIRPQGHGGTRPRVDHTGKADP